MRRRRFVGLSLLIAWLIAPGAEAFAAFSHGPDDACHGQVCQCRRHCPPTRPAEADCHGRSKAKAPCEMSSRCTHDNESAPIASRPEWLPSPTQALALFVASTSAPEQVSGEPVAGHSRIDPRPPRTTS